MVERAQDLGRGGGLGVTVESLPIPRNQTHAGTFSAADCDDSGTLTCPKLLSGVAANAGWGEHACQLNTNREVQPKTNEIWAVQANTSYNSAGMGQPAPCRGACSPYECNFSLASIHFIFHVLLHLILHCSSFLLYFPYR